MIESLVLHGVGTYTDYSLASLKNLTCVNFLYGANGSGKTTIGKVIERAEDWPECSVNWHEGRRRQVLVYNQDYVRDKIKESHLAGVFTIGENAREKEETIAAKKEEIEKIVNKDQKENRFRQIQMDRYQQTIGTFKDHCWNERLRIEKENGFQEAFGGVRADKGRLLTLVENLFQKPAVPQNLDELRAKANTIYGDVLELQPLLEAFPLAVLDELEKIKTPLVPIIGKADVPIGILIQQLNNNDWVNQGRTLLTNADSQCPFCQQPLAVSQLQAQLDAFFDETFERSLQALKAYLIHWKAEMATLEARYQSIIEGGHPQVDLPAIEEQYRSFTATAELIVTKLTEKIANPSNVVELSSLGDIVRQTNETLDEANTLVLMHNTTIANLDAERTALRENIWHHFRNNLSLKFTEYKAALLNCQGHIDRKSAAIAELNQRKKKLEEEIFQLEREVTSISPTVKAINKILEEFHFTTFYLAEAKEREGFYKIVRPGGKPAQHTLSEGEKTFLTFLYFYFSVRGGVDEAAGSEPRIVVFDDPISSLDSNILSIVSTLIRSLITDIIDGGTPVKQVFLLTHNVYFHKEVTFRFEQYANEDNKRVSFWVVRRQGLTSRVDRYPTNPVQSAYEMLWASYRKDQGAIGLQNTMRKILENYFKVMGGISLDELVKEFEGDQKHICRSLVSWMHDGSHNILDDLYMSPSQTQMKTYKEVFRLIFIHLNHEGHYKMMMKRP
jgi:wobble nucleotide-excising tRNase